MTYLDYAATTPLEEEIIVEMLPYMKSHYGNASSVHGLGREARLAIERARNQIAGSLGVQQGEILFTGSASEANNLVVKGVVERVSQLVSDQRSESLWVPEIIISGIEHPCVMEAARHVERLGWAKVVWLPVTQSGHVMVEDVAQAINERTVLVSVMYVNNEIGSVQPIKEIGEVIAKEKGRRKKEQGDLPIYFHTDAVQAVQYFDCSPATLGVDLMTFAAHKAYGPKGVGVLYKQSNVQLTRQIDGGGQEYYLRAGTENVANIVGSGLAITQAIGVAKSGQEMVRISSLRQRLVDAVKDTVSDVVVVGEGTEMAPHIVNFVIKDCDAEALIAALDQEGFAVSSGSACSSGVVKKSHVIEALGLGIEKYAPLRVSMGKETTEEEVTEFSRVLSYVVGKIRDLGI